MPHHPREGHKKQCVETAACLYAGCTSHKCRPIRHDGEVVTRAINHAQPRPNAAQNSRRKIAHWKGKHASLRWLCSRLHLLEHFRNPGTCRATPSCCCPLANCYPGCMSCGNHMAVVCVLQNKWWRAAWTKQHHRCSTPRYTSRRAPQASHQLCIATMQHSVGATIEGVGATMPHAAATCRCAGRLAITWQNF